MSFPTRRPLIAGNWKMHLNLAQSMDLAKAVRDGAKNATAEVAICVPFTAISVVADILKSSPVKLGAQDLYWESQGAYTGEISAAQLADAGCAMVIIGHSERRRLFNDTDEAINKLGGLLAQEGRQALWKRFRGGSAHPLRRLRDRGERGRAHGPDGP